MAGSDPYVRLNAMRRALKRWPITMSFRAALLLLTVGSVAVYLGRRDTLAEWAPNIAATSVGLAITITAVEWIVRKEARARLQPRVKPALQEMSLSLLFLTSAIMNDYAQTHRGIEVDDLPGETVGMCERWFRDRDREDKQRTYLSDDGQPFLIEAGREFAEQLADTRGRSFDVLEPDLVSAIDLACQELGFAIGEVPGAAAGTGSGTRDALLGVVGATWRFADVFSRYRHAGFVKARHR
jgi:hypothetical protein